jgi:integrase
MPRVADEMGPLDVKRAVHAGGEVPTKLPVGGVTGLYLQITPNGAKSWLLRMTTATSMIKSVEPDGSVREKRRQVRTEIGLGGYPSVTLAQAREKAREARDKIERGINPVAERKTVKASLSAAHDRGLTFAEAVTRYLAVKLDGFRNAKHRQQWENTLATYALPHLGKMMVQDIEVRDVLRVLQPHWTDKTETASRLRGRIEAVLSWATVAGHRSGDNPARWAGNLKELLPAPSKVAKEGNQPALTIDDAPRWFAALKGRDGMGARALEFLSLTASRSQEVRGAAWDEIDVKAGIWTIPAARMKMDREHRVPLSDDAVALLGALPRHAGNPLVFPAQRGGQLSDMTLSATMKRMHEAEVAADRSGFVDRASKRPAVPHGLRSTFRDWVAERTNYPGDMAEVALAHKIGNAVEASYRRGDMIEKRRAMMAAWAGHLTGASEATVHVLRAMQ